MYVYIHKNKLQEKSCLLVVLSCLEANKSFLDPISDIGSVSSSVCVFVHFQFFFCPILDLRCK